MLLQLPIETTEVAVFPGVPLVTLLAQALFDFLQQALGLNQVATDHRNFDDSTELKQVLLHQMLMAFASGQQRGNSA